jgi:hypothetical protein
LFPIRMSILLVIAPNLLICQPAMVRVHSKDGFYAL